MSIPKYHQFMRPILDLLGNNQIYARKSIYQNLAKWAKLTDEEMQQLLASGRQLIYINRISWALTYLKKANLIESPKEENIKSVRREKGCSRKTRR
jgi:restriction system protein